MTEQVDPVSKAARLIAETIILHDNEWVSFRDIVESAFGDENLDAVVEILSDHLARRVIAASPLPQAGDELVARLRNLNPWKELDWPEVVNKAVERIAALTAERDDLLDKLDDRTVMHHTAEELCDNASAAEAERDEHLTELGKVIMACPPGMRLSPASHGVRKLREAKESAEARLADALAALKCVRAFFDRYSHEYAGELAFIDATLSRLTAEQKGGE